MTRGRYKHTKKALESNSSQLHRQLSAYWQAKYGYVYILIFA